MIDKPPKYRALRNSIIHLITSGQYDNYHIVAAVRGLMEPTLETLWYRFRQQYNIPAPYQGKLKETIMSASVLKYRERYYKAMDGAEVRLVNEGYKDMNADKYGHHSLAGLFVDWLVKNYHYTAFSIDELNLPR